MNIVDKARQFAVRAHWGQMYGSVPYIQHLEEVYNVLSKHVKNEEVLAAAILHDSLEDTNVTFEMLVDEFSYHVATLVQSVTDEEVSDEEIKDREALDFGRKQVKRMLAKRKTYPKILSNKWGIYIKLADRIANIKHSVTAKNKEMIERYRDEHKEFERTLRKGDIAKELWAVYKQIITSNINK